MSDNLAIPVRRRAVVLPAGFGPTRDRTVLSQMGTATVTSLMWPIAALLTGGRKLLLAIVVLNIPLQLGTHLFYDDDLAAKGALGGLDISAGVIALAGLYVLWLLEFLLNKTSRPPRPRLHWSLVLFLAAAAISMLAAQNVSLASFELFAIVEAILMYVYVASWVRTRADVVFILQYLFIGLIVESLLMMYVGLYARTSFKVAGLKVLVDAEHGGYFGLPRVGGSAGSPNGTAGYIAMLIAPGIALLFTNVSRFSKYLAALSFSLGAVALWLTFSRGGWLATLLSIGLLFAVAYRRIHIPPSVIFGAVALLLLAAVGVGARSTSVDDKEAATGRIPLIRLAFNMIEDNPYIGVGINNFPVRIDDYATPDIKGDWLYTVHNKYLLIWSEMGVVGLIAFVWFLCLIFRRGFHCWKARDPFLSPIALSLTAALIGVSIHMMLDVYRDAQFYWLGGALITAIWHQTQRKLPRQTPRAHPDSGTNPR